MVLASIIASFAVSQTTFERVPLQNNEIFGDLGEQWIAMMETFGVTGFSVSAIKDGKVVLLDGIGDSDPANGRPANIDTRFYIASITKTMTATAIAQLAEQGKIDLDAPVQKYLPRFTLADTEYAKSVTVRDLLCHCPGINSEIIVMLDAYSGEINDDRFYEALATVEPTKQPTYTNVHFTILGRVIEAVSGQEWRKYLAENVFSPLGMTRTTGFVSDIYNDTNFAVPLRVSASGSVVTNYMKTDRTMHAAGGILTTPRDMTKYLMAWIHEGESNGNRFLMPQTVRDALSHQSTFESSAAIRRFTGYGYAWNVGDYRETKGFAAHGGGYSGYMSYIAMLPESKSAIAVFVNTGDTGGAFGTLLVVDLLDRLAGYPIDQELWRAYIARAEDYKEHMKSLKPFGANPALSGQLSLKPEAYAGEYYNDLLGTVTVTFSGGKLRLDWGDLPQMLKSTGVDEFTAHDDEASPGTHGRFIVRNGAATGIGFSPGGQEIVFDRVRD